MFGTEDRTMVSPSRAQGQSYPCLSRQGSLYNLTFNEVNHQLGNVGGKPLNTMSLDELLKNIVSVEEGQQLQNHHSSSSSSSSSSSASSFLGNFNLLNGTLSKKTVDEVWKEIVNQEHVTALDVSGQMIQKQLGEITLEDFLLRAGLINTGNQNGTTLDPQPIMTFDPMEMVTQQADWLQFQMETMHHQQQLMTVLETDFRVPEVAYNDPENQVEDGGENSDNHMVIAATPVSAISAATSSESCDPQAASEKKRRYSDEVMERSFERRQKRMIKNRESAARSRARKQAYTNQLELEVFRLRKTNSLLKKQKEVEMLLSSDQTPLPRYQIRRTSSAPF